MKTYLITRWRILGGSSAPLSVSSHHVTTANGLLRLAKPNRPGEGVRLWANRETAEALGYVAERVHAFHPDREDLPTLGLCDQMVARRGRPAGSTDPDARRERVIVRVSAEESARISAEARAAGKTVSEYVRDRALRKR